MEDDPNFAESIRKIKEVAGTLDSLGEASQLVETGQYDQAQELIANTIESDATFGSDEELEVAIEKLATKHEASRKKLADLCDSMETRILSKDLSNDAISKWIFLTNVLQQPERVGELYRKAKELPGAEESDLNFQFKIKQILQKTESQLIASHESELLRESFFNKARLLLTMISRLESELLFPMEDSSSTENRFIDDQKEFISSESIACLDLAVKTNSCEKAQIIINKTLQVVSDFKTFNSFANLVKEVNDSDLKQFLITEANKHLSPAEADKIAKIIEPG